MKRNLIFRAGGDTAAVGSDSSSVRRIIKRFLSHHDAFFDLAKRGEMLVNFITKRVHDSDYLFFANFNELKSGLFVDIGANCGQSALSFAAVNKKMAIMSFEPNKMLEKDLKLVARAIGPRYCYHLFGLGHEDSRRDFFVPRVRRSLRTQEGTFVLDELARARDRIGQDYEIVKLEFDIINFDRLNLAPTFVKIDVQGFELSVVAGMTATLENCRPLLMIENNSQIDAIGMELARTDYELFSYDSAANKLGRPVDRQSRNYFALPHAGSENAQATDIAWALTT
ncbi:MAG: FkbM family methyltransferase [candidate division Zixibacteria bacterium]|nr:FkbM family methyltransferase [candidate division Zixibacteria bacterium]